MHCKSLWIKASAKCINVNERKVREKGAGIPLSMLQCFSNGDRDCVCVALGLLLWTQGCWHRQCRRAAPIHEPTIWILPQITLKLQEQEYIKLNEYWLRAPQSVWWRERQSSRCDDQSRTLMAAHVCHIDCSAMLRLRDAGNLNGQSSPARFWENDICIFCTGLCRTAMMPGCCFRVSNVLLGVFQHVIGYCWMVAYSQKSWCLWWCPWAYLLPSHQSKTT